MSDEKYVQHFNKKKVEKRDDLGKLTFFYGVD